MTSQRPWPQRFRVRIHIGPSAAIPYSVVTWHAAEKAVAIAVQSHLRRYADGGEIRDVEVEDLGPVGRDAHGAMLLEPADITDRSEF